MTVITYAIEPNGDILSRCCVDGECQGYAVRMYESSAGPEDLTGTSYICNALFYTLKWTKAIPIEIKNLHRKFWGMKPLKERSPSYEMEADRLHS